MSVKLDELGGHADHPPGALSKHEVAAALIQAGIAAGFWVIPEFEISCAGGRRRVDVVWARRDRQVAGRLWQIVAAFEIEGHDVALGSIAKNVESLRAAREAGARIVAMVLFQIGGDGKYWHNARPSFQPGDILQSACVPGESPETVRDDQLLERFSEWVESLRT